MRKLLTKIKNQKNTDTLILKENYIKCNCGNDFMAKPPHPSVVVISCRCGAIYSLEGRYMHTVLPFELREAKEETITITFGRGIKESNESIGREAGGLIRMNAPEKEATFH